jgi:hypothetical protein
MGTHNSFDSHSISPYIFPLGLILTVILCSFDLPTGGRSRFFRPPWPVAEKAITYHPSGCLRLQIHLLGGWANAKPI